MKYDELKLKVLDTKVERNAFLKSFTKETSVLKEILIKNTDNIIVNSIRLHKFLTNSGDLGKVKTARFLEAIELDENTKIADLNKKHIESIIEFIKQ